MVGHSEEEGMGLQVGCRQGVHSSGPGPEPGACLLKSRMLLCPGSLVFVKEIPLLLCVLCSLGFSLNLTALIFCHICGCRIGGTPILLLHQVLVLC